MLFNKNPNVTALRTYLKENPMLHMTLRYDYGGGNLQFWKVSANSISALDSLGNRVSFTNESEYMFLGDCFYISEARAMAGGVRRLTM